MTLKYFGERETMLGNQLIKTGNKNNNTVFFKLVCVICTSAFQIANH